MARVKNVAGDARDIPLAGGIVENGDTFEIDDDTFWQHEWPEANFEVVEQPKTRKPADPTEDGPPSKSANKGEWVEYALARGADPDVVNDLTIAQLIDQYGEDN